MRGDIARRGITGKASYPHARPLHGNRGVILLVILGMLQLLALIGLTFTLFAAQGGPSEAIERVQQDVQHAQAALAALLETPDDTRLQDLALVSVDRALQESTALIDVEKPPTPETRHLQGLLQAAGSLSNQLVALLRDPPPR
jgi:hypothetical protein